jgi:hypothetical protein
VRPMTSYSVQPFVGVGPVRLGMSRAEVHSTFAQAPKAFRKGPCTGPATDAFHNSAFQVFYDKQSDTAEYIELSRNADFRAFYREMDVFATPADEVAAFISRDASYDKSEREFPYSYIFRELQLSLWRPVLPEDDESGRFFSTIGVGRKGYYDDVA